jgi:GTP-binding protein
MVKAALKDQYEVLAVSALLHDKINALLYKIKDVLASAPFFPLYEEKDQDVKVYDAHLDLKEEFKIEKTGPHSFRIYGERIERTYSLINLTSDEGVLKLLSILRNLKVDDELKRLGAVDGDSVTLCDFEFEYYE